MIKSIHILGDFATIKNNEVKQYLAQFESDLMRGMNTLIILDIVIKNGEEGAHAYQINKYIQEKTKNIISIEEGTLYILLKKLEKENLLTSIVSTKNNRKIKNYTATSFGKMVHSYGFGFIAIMLSVFIDENTNPLKINSPFFPPQSPVSYLCPNCSNLVYHEHIESKKIRYCMICGCYLGELIENQDQNSPKTNLGEKNE